MVTTQVHTFRIIIIIFDVHGCMLHSAARLLLGHVSFVTAALAHGLGVGLGFAHNQQGHPLSRQHIRLIEYTLAEARHPCSHAHKSTCLYTHVCVRCFLSAMLMFLHCTVFCILVDGAGESAKPNWMNDDDGDGNAIANATACDTRTRTLRTQVLYASHSNPKTRQPNYNVYQTIGVGKNPSDGNTVSMARNIFSLFNYECAHMQTYSHAHKCPHNSWHCVRTACVYVLCLRALFCPLLRDEMRCWWCCAFSKRVRAHLRVDYDYCRQFV